MIRHYADGWLIHCFRFSLAATPLLMPLAGDISYAIATFDSCHY
jgi:hypothetical protein